MSAVSGAWAYADAVVAGRRIACPKVVAVCQRHLDCLEAWAKGKYWCRFDEQKAAVPGALCRELLNVKGVKGEREPFELLDWQQFLTESWNGWRVDQRHVPHPMFYKEGSRRFRRILLLTGRGSGKTPIAAVFILMSMLEERDAVCICAAKTEDQARRPWEEFRRMAQADRNGILDTLFEFTGGKKIGDAAMIRSRDPRSEARFQCIGNQTNPGPYSGLICNLVIAEELCFHSSADVLNILEGNFKNRFSPTLLMLTNAGTYRALLARDEYVQAERMCEGLLDWRDDFLPLIYEVPEDQMAAAMEQDPETGMYTPEARQRWRMANPSIDSGAVGEDYIAKELADGVLNEATMEDKKREIFSYWPITLDSGNLAFDYRLLEKLEGPRPPEDVLRRARLTLALDLGDTLDFSALALVWKLPDGSLYVEVRHYTPGGTVDQRGERADVPLGTWARRCIVQGCTKHKCGHRRIIQTCPGGSTDYGLIADDIEELIKGYNVRCLAFDRKFMYRVHDELERRNSNLKFSRRGMLDVQDGRMVLIDHPQGGHYPGDENALAMGKSLDLLMGRFGRKDIRFQWNPFLRWQTTCTTVRIANKAAGRKYLDVAELTKGRTGWNDGWLAVTMGVGTADWTYSDAKGSRVDLGDMYEALSMVQ